MGCIMIINKEDAHILAARIVKRRYSTSLENPSIDFLTVIKLKSTAVHACTAAS